MDNFLNRSVLRTIRNMDGSHLRTVEFFDANGTRRCITLTDTMYEMAEHMLRRMIHEGYLQFIESDGKIIGEIVVEKTLLASDEKAYNVNPTIDFSTES